MSRCHEPNQAGLLIQNARSFTGKGVEAIAGWVRTHKEDGKSCGQVGIIDYHELYTTACTVVRVRQKKRFEVNKSLLFFFEPNGPSAETPNEGFSIPSPTERSGSWQFHYYVRGNSKYWWYSTGKQRFEVNRTMTIHNIGRRPEYVPPH